jgi:hypothetical protein
MKEQADAIHEFWIWFQNHEDKFGALVSADDPFWDIAVQRLQRLDRRLWFELSEPDGANREFIVTAEGCSAVFPLVDEIIAKAPQLPGWVFIALKPAMGFDFTTTYEGVRFEPRKMWFLPLENASNPHRLGLRVGIANLTPAIERQANDAVATIIQTGLGERSAALDIQHLEVSALPSNPKSAGYIELNELRSYIEWRRSKHPTIH